MGFGPARPPMTEDVEEVIAKDIKSVETKGQTSEVPLAFSRPPPAPAADGNRKYMIVGAIAVVLAVLLGIWLL